MLFSEVYSSYFNAVAAILAEAISGDLSEKRLNEIIYDKAFSESILHILPAIKNEDWKLVDNKLSTPIKHVPTMPLTTLQKQWLKSMLLDPRIALFGLSEEGLEDVEPLYMPEDFYYFDRYTDGDPYEDADYIANFRTILNALADKRKLGICFSGRKGGSFNLKCIPYRMEYSAKDDKFRLLTAGSNRFQTINLARIQKCELLESYRQDEFNIPDSHKKTLVIELEDERNALERAMLQFSYLEKETEKLDNRSYRITLHYARDEETEILISIMSFGPRLRVVSPDAFINLIKERLKRQSHISR
ncbi:MAG: WYL domain-containing protein [Christensenellales bacterium]|jgi:hypothetical protein